jgi:chorismate mutase
LVVLKRARKQVYQTQEREANGLAFFLFVVCPSLSINKWAKMVCIGVRAPTHTIFPTHLNLTIRSHLMPTRGIRGAVTSEADTPEAILAASCELLQGILAANPALQTEDIGSVFFTVTDDLAAVHPALAARQLGWTDVPLLCAREIPVPGSLPRTIRVLLHWNTELPQGAIRHVYLGAAAVLRPDHSVADLVNRSNSPIRPAPPRR